jgi:outer membrane receptor protein involved in Fe transport
MSKNLLTTAPKLFGGASVAALALSGIAHAQGTVEEIVVTAEKREASVQDVPIAVSAFSQDSLEALQIDGGPNLVLAIPNVNFSKGNFTGYNFQIRGIGTKLVSATADAATGVHLNGAPLTANNLFEAEFYDVERVEVLRGPQGTLYGRNATGGVINVITAKPQPGAFEAFAQGTAGNFDTYRGEGMVNLPLGDTAALRVAGAVLSRGGFAENLTTGNDVDGRDLWSLRATLGVDMTDNVRAWFLYEHFEEDDDRLRTGKQLCVKDPGPTSVGGVPVPAGLARGFLSQGCKDGPVLESRESLNSSATLGGLLGNLTGLIAGDAFAGKLVPQDLRVIESAFDPVYRAAVDLYSLNFEWDLGDSLTLTSLTSYAQNEIFSNEDYNKVTPAGTFLPNPLIAPTGFVNDPQVGRSNLFRTFDVSRGTSEQITQEIRLQSSFDGPLNFNFGGIYIDFETLTDYYVFSNTLSANAQIQAALAALPPGVIPGTVTGNPGAIIPIDPGTGSSSIEANITDTGRNYFLSRTPYTLDAFAIFGELYWDLSDTFKLTAGLRYTNDEKTVVNNLTTLLTPNSALPPSVGPFLTDPSQPSRSVQFEEWTGRFGADWKFSDDGLLYAFYSRGYKGGGINPPPAFGVPPILPTYDPEFIDAYEIGTKNTLFDGALQANATGFFYDYQGYQVSKIVNRTSLNENIDAEVAGLEFESIWAPTANLLFTLNAGYIQTEIVGGSSIDTLNRTQGNPALTVVKASSTANCVVPTAGVATILGLIQTPAGAVPGISQNPTALLGLCSGAFAGLTGAFGLPAGALTPSDGIAASIEGNELPNTPQVTFSFGAQYTQPLGGAWELKVRGDYYWQDESYARIYNTRADELPAWDNINASISLVQTDQDLEIKVFGKNLQDEDVVTDIYFTDDSSGLFRNIFLLEPRTWGVTVSKKF